jgi:hypothetical protein
MGSELEAICEQPLHQQQHLRAVWTAFGLRVDVESVVLHP